MKHKTATITRETPTKIHPHPINAEAGAEDPTLESTRGDQRKPTPKKTHPSARTEGIPTRIPNRTHTKSNISLLSSGTPKNAEPNP